MGIWKRAWIYLLRKKKRSVLLLFLLSVTGIFLLAGTAIRTGADKAAEEVRQSMRSGLVIERSLKAPEEELFTSTWEEDGVEVVDAKANLFTKTCLEEISKMEGVSGYFVQYTGWDVYTGLKLQPGYCSLGTNGEHWIEEYGMPKDAEEEKRLQEEIKSNRLWSSIMEFHTVLEGKWEPSFLNGSLTIVDGRNIERTDKRKTVISEVVAKKNNLGVGDTITVRNYEPLTSDLYGSELELEIVGIFRINFKQSYSEVTFEYQMIENMAFTDGSMNEWSRKEYHMHYNGRIPGYRVGKAAQEVGSARIFVEDPNMLPSVKEQVLAMEEVDWQYYEIELDDTDYRVAAKPLLLIKNLFTVCFIVLFISMFLILSLVLSMWVRSRNQEIGILISAGIRKKQILLQLLLECCIIAAAAFFLAGALYRPVTDVTADAVRKMFRPAQEKEDYKMKYDLASGTFEIHREMSKPIDLEYEITAETVYWIFFLMLVHVAVAVLRSSMQIAGRKPKDILLRQ